jgi:hypothetical protein
MKQYDTLEGIMAESEYMTVADARDYLGVSKRKIAQLIESGTLHAEENPLDKRSKSVRRADVEDLKRRAPDMTGRKDAA